MEFLPSHINVDEWIAKISEPWDPIEIGTFNGQVIRLARFSGEYHWHTHEEEDELFMVYRGEITIQIRNSEDLTIRAGEMGIVPKSIEHCPKSDGDSYVLMIEPSELTSGGNRSTHQ